MIPLRFLTFTFWKYYVLKLLRLETVTFSDATLSDINIVLCYVLSKYQFNALLVRNQNWKIYFILIHFSSLLVCVRLKSWQKVLI